MFQQLQVIICSGKRARRDALTPRIAFAGLCKYAPGYGVQKQEADFSL